MKQIFKKAGKPIAISLALLASIVALYYLVPYCILTLAILNQNKSRYPEIIYDHPLADKSFISDDPCGPPCWYGLVPGVSTYSEVKNTINGLEFVGTVNIQNYDDVTYFHLECPYIEGRHGTSCATLELNNGTLFRINHVIAYTLTLEDAVGKLGNPDQFYAALDHGNCEITLQWINKGIQVTHYEYSLSECVEIYQDNLKPSSTLLVRDVYYQPPNSILCFVDCYVWDGFRK